MAGFTSFLSYAIIARKRKRPKENNILLFKKVLFAEGEWLRSYN